MTATQILSTLTLSLAVTLLNAAPTPPAAGGTASLPASGTATAAPAARARLPAPPVAPRQPKDVSVHGERRIDDYFWLRQRKDPRVMAYLKAENAYTAAWLAPYAGLQDTLYREMVARVPQNDEQVPVRKGAWWYASRVVEGQQHPIEVRRPAVGPERAYDPKAPEQVLLDVNVLARNKPAVSLEDFEISPDGERLAYSVDENGARDHKVYVKDLTSGKPLAVKLPPVDSIAWGNDSRTLYYVTHDEARRSNKLWRHRLGSRQRDVLLHQERDELFDLGLHKTRDERYLVVSSSSKDTTELRVIDADQPEAAPRLVLPRHDGIEAQLEHRDGLFYLLIDDTGPQFRLVTVDAAQPDLARATELIAHRDDVMLEELDLFKQHMVVTERAAGSLRLRVREFGSAGDGAAPREHTVAFDEPAYTVDTRDNAEFDTTTLRFRYTSLTTPNSTYDYDLASRQRTLRKQQTVVGGYDPKAYLTERREATAPDGTKVPVTTVWRRDMKRDGPQPLLLYGYGAYGFPNDPTFSAARLSLLDRGVIFALAHVRGGGDLGRPWYEAGKLAHKMNSFTDFIACAETLVAEGLTSPQQLVIQGGSAGGLLMGAVTNLRPDLFKAVVAEVPFVDVINSMLDETLPLTVGEFLEWGNPKLPDQYAWMRAYSPYDNLKAGAYPALLVETGLNDSQVAYWEPAKYVAKLRTLKTDDHPLLLHVQLGAGHQGATGRFDALKERALSYTFMLTQWDLAGS